MLFDKLTVKSSLDIVFISCYILTPFFTIFSKFQLISVSLLSYTIDDSDLALPISSPGEICEDLVFTSDCSLFSQWHSAGVLFLCVGGLSVMICTVGLIGNLSIKNHWKLRKFEYWGIHYLFPFIFIIALCFYYYLSDIFNDGTFRFAGKTFTTIAGPGFYLMIASQLSSIISAGIYTYTDIDYNQDLRENLSPQP